MSPRSEGSGLQQHPLCAGEPRTVAGPKSKQHPRDCAVITAGLLPGRRLFAGRDICRDSPCQGEQDKRTQRRR